MVIYKQAMKKYFKAPSTWIILVISFVISGFLAAYLPFRTSTAANTYAYYGYEMILSTGVITSMLSIFSSIFAGFKAASMFRDEVENGTFLVMLSKPQTRFRIIFQKWLALQSMMIIFAASNIFIYEICVVCFDSYKDFKDLENMEIKPISRNIAVVGGYLFLVLFVIGLIFSSIALLISTKFSSATTIGISIALGVIVPITAMVGMFTEKKMYDPKDNLLLDQIRGKFRSAISKVDASRGGSLSEEELAKFDAEISKLNKLVEDPTKGLYHVGVDSELGDKFHTTWGADLSYQFTLMGSMSTDTLVTDAYKGSLTRLGISSTMAPKIKTVRDPRDPLIGKSVSEAETIVFNNLKRTVLEVRKVGLLMQDMLLNRSQPLIYWDSAYKKYFAMNEREASLVANIEDFIHRPINVIINKGHITGDALKEWYSNIPESVNYESFAKSVQFNDKTNKKDAYLNSEDEEETYSALMAIVHNNLPHFGYVKSVDYADKHMLLWIYIAIAAVLVPSSFLLMRKKDFR